MAQEFLLCLEINTQLMKQRGMAVAKRVSADVAKSCLHALGTILELFPLISRQFGLVGLPLPIVL
jgi:hypothetical protein